MGLAYIGAVLRLSGYNVTICDLNGTDYTAKDVAKELATNAFEILGLSLPFQCGLDEALEFIKHIRNAGYRGFLAVGGHPATFLSQAILNKCPEIDCIVRGEGEYTLCELVDNLVSQRDWRCVRGIVYRENARICKTSDRQLVNDIDALPFPVRDTYLQFSRNIPGFPMGIVTSRGCYKRCSFCDVQTFYSSFEGASYRRRSPQNVIDEVELCINKYKTTSFHFSDDNFVGGGQRSLPWVTAIIDEVKKRKLRLSFNIVCCVEDVDKDLFAALKDIGLNRVFLGIESWIPRSNHVFRKPCNPDHARRAINVLDDLDLIIQCGSIFAESKTTLEEMAENLEQWHSLGLFNPDSCAKLEVFEGTPICSELRKEGVLIEDGFSYSYKFNDVRVSRVMKLIENYRLEYFIPQIRRAEKFRLNMFQNNNSLSYVPPELIDIENKVNNFVTKLQSEWFSDFVRQLINRVGKDEYDDNSIMDEINIKIEDVKSEITRYRSEARNIYDRTRTKQCTQTLKEEY
jgi:biotin synthase-like enzyme